MQKATIRRPQDPEKPQETYTRPLASTFSPEPSAAKQDGAERSRRQDLRRIEATRELADRLPSVPNVTTPWIARRKARNPLSRRPYHHSVPPLNISLSNGTNPVTARCFRERARFPVVPVSARPGRREKVRVKSRRARGEEGTQARRGRGRGGTGKEEGSQRVSSRADRSRAPLSERRARAKRAGSDRRGERRRRPCWLEWAEVVVERGRKKEGVGKGVQTPLLRRRGGRGASRALQGRGWRLCVRLVRPRPGKKPREVRQGT